MSGLLNIYNVVCMTWSVDVYPSAVRIPVLRCGIQPPIPNTIQPSKGNALGKPQKGLFF